MLSCGCNGFAETDIMWAINYIKNFKDSQEDDFKKALDIYMKTFFNSYQIGAIYDEDSKTIYLAQATEDKEQLAEIAKNVNSLSTSLNELESDLSDINGDIETINNSIAYNIESATANGLTVRCVTFGRAIEILITGKPTEELNTSSNYANIATMSKTVFPSSSILKYIVCGSNISCQLAATGSTIRLGYAKTIDTNQNTNISNSIYIKETFVID